MDTKTSQHSCFFHFLFLALFYTFLAPSAYADRLINSATLNGALNTTATPSASITAVVNVTTNGTGTNNDWGSTQWRIGNGSYTCVNHPNHTDSGSYSETFTITAPAIFGTYNADFIAYRNDSCSAGASAVYTLKNGVSVSPPLSTCGTEDFTEYNASVPLTANWNIITATNYTPNVQNGRLILTDTTLATSTAITLRGGLPANNNYLEITFQPFAYGGNGADGMTVTLSDASVTPAAGAFGGSLGYAQKSNPGSDCTTPGGCPGFAGGWFGFGLDEYGNFSNPTEGRIGGPGFRPDSFSIRGSGSVGYPYVAGTTTLIPGIDDTGGTPANPLPGHYYRLLIDTRNASTLVRVERDTGNGFVSIIPWTNATPVAVTPENYLLSLTASTGANTNYHAADNFSLKALSCGTIQIIPPSIRGNFDAWDPFRSINNRNISTKIVGKPFNVTIASLDASRSIFQDYNGTVCARIVNLADQNLTGWNKLLFNSTANELTTFTLSRAVGGDDSAVVDIHWKNNVNTTCPIPTLETDTSHSSDRFSVRPASFTINAPNAVAGSDFNITFTAPDFSAIPSADYNESAGNSFDITYIEHNVSCLAGTFNPVLNSGWTFANGTKPRTTRYSESGIVDVTISDISKECTSRYTRIDCNDANVYDGTTLTANLLPIGSAQKQITVIPHHFDLNATLLNSGGGSFTYLSRDLNISSRLNLNVTAKNADGNTTSNYDKGCYAKATTLTLSHSTVPAPLSTILYHENLSGMDGNITKSSPINLSFDNSVFTQGSAPLSILINFDRERSAPLNPFDFNLSSANLNDSDNVNGTTVPSGSASYVYGRARAYDIKTDQSLAPNPIELEVYSTTPLGYVEGMPQNVLKWYRNLNHNSSEEGSILSGDDFASNTKTGTSSTITIVRTSSPQNGLHSITITNPDAIPHAIVHLEVPSWLWYSTTNDYSFDTGTTCSQHPCFDYQFFGTPQIQGVSSGTFTGSDFPILPVKKIIKKGDKVFR